MFVAQGLLNRLNLLAVGFNSPENRIGYGILPLFGVEVFFFDIVIYIAGFNQYGRHGTVGQHQNTLLFHPTTAATVVFLKLAIQKP